MEKENRRHCCMCQGSDERDDRLKLTIHGAYVHPQCLENAALGSLIPELIPEGLSEDIRQVQDKQKEVKPLPMFRLERSEQGFATAIAIGDWFLIHLHVGTERNEENADKLLAVLNTAVTKINHNVGNDTEEEGIEKEIALRNALTDLIGGRA